MRISRLTFALVAAGLLAGLLAAQPAFSMRQVTKTAPSTGVSPSQPKAPQSGNADKGYGGRERQDGAAKGKGDGRGMAGLPPKWIDNLRDMSPEEQQRFMGNNRRFQSLPPQRQMQIRRNLQKWNSLSTTERNAIRDRERTWEQMSPQQRRYVQDVLLPKWQSMPQDRRTLINGRLHVLQGMTTTQQQEALKSSQFMQGLSPDEQQMLREVNSLRNPPLP